MLWYNMPFRHVDLFFDRQKLVFKVGFFNLVQSSKGGDDLRAARNNDG